MKYAVIFDVDSTLTNNRDREQFASDFVGDKKDKNGKRNEPWHDMFQDGRLYHLDRPIGSARVMWHRLNTQVIDRADRGVELSFILLSGRRDTPENHTRFEDWLIQHGFPAPTRIIFRPVGQETDSWKHSVMESLIGKYEIIAGYGNERDMPVYEEGGFEAILVDEEGKGWKMPERWDEVVHP